MNQSNKLTGFGLAALCVAASVTLFLATLARPAIAGEEELARWMRIQITNFNAAFFIASFGAFLLLAWVADKQPTRLRKYLGYALAIGVAFLVAKVMGEQSPLGLL